MQIDWFGLLLVIAGGVVGISGGLLTAIVGNTLATKKARRDDLLAAYVEWTRAIHHAIYEAEHLWLYDAFEELKEAQSNLEDFPSSVTGRTREEHTRDYLTATDALRAAEARLLILERYPEMRQKVSELSQIEAPENDDVPQIIQYMKNKRIKIRDFLEDVVGRRLDI